MTSPTTPRDAIGLSERLRQMPSSLNDACRTMEEAATQLDALQARVKELEAARMGQIDYSVDLQRIIEGLCHGRTIREPQTGARHHYDMAIEYQARATCAEQEQTALIRDYQRVNSQLADEMQRATRAEQERDEALERLKPFATQAECWTEHPDNRAMMTSDGEDLSSLDFMMCDLRAAGNCVRRLESGPDKEKRE